MFCSLLFTGRVEGGGQPVLSCEQCFCFISCFPSLFAFGVGGLGFEFCLFVGGMLFGVLHTGLLNYCHSFEFAIGGLD